MQDHIFVLLMQTGTSVAKVLQFFTRKPYNHASVALDLTLEEMYSFCRNHIHFPLPAGFNQEIVGEGTLGRFLVIPCEIYAIPVTKEKKQEFEQNLAYFKNHRSMFSYNVLGLGTTFLRIRWKVVEKTQAALFSVRGNPACTVRCPPEQTAFPAHTGRLAVYFRCPPHLSGRIEPLLSYLCKVDSAAGGFHANVFKPCLIAAASKTDTAGSHLLLQKPERAALFPVFVWGCDRCSARAILARLRRSAR